MIRLVEKAGWVLDRHDGTSHRHFYHPTIPGILTIAGADHKELDRFAEKKIKKQAGLR